MRQFTFGLVFLVLIVYTESFLHNYVYAEENKIEEIHIQVMIDDQGDAHVTNYRRGDYAEGTENYISLINYGNSSIENLKVTEDGREYEYVDDWDLDASLEEKAFKSGMIHTVDGVELSWGIGEYGSHEYIVEYDVINFVKQLEDTQMFYWQFISPGMTPAPEKVTIEIEASEPFSRDNVQVWDAGYFREAEFVDGKIVIKSDEPFTQENYVLLLIQFFNNMVTAEDVLEGEFVEYLTDFQAVSRGRGVALTTDSHEDSSGDTNGLDIEPSKDGLKQDREDSTTENKPKPVADKWDDDVEGNFGDLLIELLEGIINFFKSLFN